MISRLADDLDNEFLNARFHSHRADLGTAMLDRCRIGKRLNIELFKMMGIEAGVPPGNDLLLIFRPGIIYQDL